MDLKVEIPKIHCNRTTNEIGKDEIYFGLLVVAGKIENEQFIPSSKTPVFGKASKPKTKVTKNRSWRPEENDYVISVDDDVQVVAVTIALYEKDKGDIYEEVRNQFSGIVDPEGFNWSAVAGEAKEILIRDVNNNGNVDFPDIWSAVNTRPELTPLVIGGFLFMVSKTIFKHLRQDDLLGSATDKFDLTEEGFDLPREYQFRKYRGKYDVGLKVSKV